MFMPSRRIHGLLLCLKCTCEVHMFEMNDGTDRAHRLVQSRSFYPICSIQLELIIRIIKDAIEIENNQRGMAKGVQYICSSIIELLRFSRAATYDSWKETRSDERAARFSDEWDECDRSDEFPAENSIAPYRRGRFASGNHERIGDASREDAIASVSLAWP